MVNWVICHCGKSKDKNQIVCDSCHLMSKTRNEIYIGE